MEQLRDSKFNYVVYTLIPYLENTNEEDRPYLKILRESLHNREDMAIKKGCISAWNHTEWNKYISKLKRYGSGHDELHKLLNIIITK